MAQQLDVLRRTGLAPSVNLLPPGITDRRSLRRQRRTLVIVGAGVLVLVLIVWYLELTRSANAAHRADDAEATVVGLERDKASLQRFADLRARLTELEEQRTVVFKGEVRGSTVLEDFTRLVPKDVWLTSLSLTVQEQPGLPGGAANQQGAAPNTGQQGAAVPGAPGTATPSSGTPVATITFSGQALSHPDVAAFIKSLNETVKRGGQPIYVNPYYTSSTAGSSSGSTGSSGSTSTVTFNGTVDLTAAAFSGRFQGGGSGTSGG
jgi:Tfp pilus assembly protein PilN